MISFTAFFGFYEAFLQIVHLLVSFRGFFLIGLVIIRKGLPLDTIGIVSFTIRLFRYILFDAGVSTVLSVSFLKDPWFFGTILEDIFELDQSIPFLSQA